MTDLTLFEIRSEIPASKAADDELRFIDDTLSDIAAARAACGKQSAEDQSGWLLALNAVETLFCQRLGKRLDEVKP